MKGYVAQSNTTGEIIWHGIADDDDMAKNHAIADLAEVTNWSLYHTRPVKQAVVHEYVLVHTQEVQLEFSFGTVQAYVVDVDGEMRTVMGSPSVALNEFNRFKNEAELSCALYVSILDKDGESILKPLVSVHRDEDMNWKVDKVMSDPGFYQMLLDAEQHERKKHRDLGSVVKGGLING
nr:MAG: hypothetical protein [Microvirus sp.]